MAGEIDSLLNRDNKDEGTSGDGKANQPTTKTISESALQITDRENDDGGHNHFEEEKWGEHQGGRYPSRGLRLRYGN